MTGKKLPWGNRPAKAVGVHDQNSGAGNSGANKNSIKILGVWKDLGSVDSDVSDDETLASGFIAPSNASFRPLASFR